MKQLAYLPAFALAAALSLPAGAQEPLSGATRAESMGIPASGHYTSFRQLDTNQDGYITRDEARDSPAVTRRFNELDRDGDGRISPEEQRAWSFVGPMEHRR